MPPSSSKTSAPPPSNIFDDDDDGWEDMPVVREDELRGGLDEEDQKKYHYQPQASSSRKTNTVNATGNLIDFDDWGTEWRSKLDTDESEYTRLRGREEDDDDDDVHLRTKYLFDEDKAMTPLSQMQQTKNMLTEAQRIAYVGLCALTMKEMLGRLKKGNRKEVKVAAASMQLWSMKIMGRLYYHMELETQEQKMIESLADHGVESMDLVPALMTTHTVANPEYDPAEGKKKADEDARVVAEAKAEADARPSSPTPSTTSTLVNPSPASPSSPNPNTAAETPTTPTSYTNPTYQTTTRILPATTHPPTNPTANASDSLEPGTVSTSLPTHTPTLILDIRFTILCDLFLLLIADSHYDSRSRTLLESVSTKLGLGWVDLVKFEARVSEALEIQEGVSGTDESAKEMVDTRIKSEKRKRYMLMGLATLGGGLVIGLSAGLLAPVIGLGLGTAFGTIGISGATTFLASAGGAAVITTGGVLTGSGIAVKGMANRTKEVRTFELLALHNNKRVSCILTVPGFLNGPLDDPRLPFSVLDPVVGDVFSLLWEPEMIRETGSALRILTTEVLTQIGQTVLQATVMATLMTALQWPIVLTKLGYLIDNPWSNALTRAEAAGRILADLLVQRHLGVRPITLIGFSLGARVIFYALLELARRGEKEKESSKKKKGVTEGTSVYGIVQDVFILGATVTASTSSWYKTRSVVGGRYVNCYARNDWVLNYLFRASAATGAGGVGAVAGLRPVEGVEGLENVDVTDKISGHMSYRTFMPLILDELGFVVTADFFDDPVEPDFEGDRVVVREEADGDGKKSGWFGSKNWGNKRNTMATGHVQRPPSTYTGPRGSMSSTGTKTSEGDGKEKTLNEGDDDDDLPPRMSLDSDTGTPSKGKTKTTAEASTPDSGPGSGAETPIAATPNLPPKHAGFDFAAIKELLNQDLDATEGDGDGTGKAVAGGRDVLFDMPRTPSSGGFPSGSGSGAVAGPGVEGVGAGAVGTGSGGIVIPPPTNRTESLPVDLPTISSDTDMDTAESDTHTPRSRTPVAVAGAGVNGLDVPVEESSLVLAKGMNRSLSLNDAPLKKATSSSSLRGRNSGLPSPELPRTPTSPLSPPPPPPDKDKDLDARSPPSVYQLPSFSSNSNGFSSPLPMSEPTLSFGGADGSIWGSSSSSRNDASLGGLSRTSASPLNASTTSLAYNPFASPGPSSSGFDPGLGLGAGAGLSFGGADGSITTSLGDAGGVGGGFGGGFGSASSGSSSSADPWAIPSDLGLGKKRTAQGLNSNPWS
ncbi:hypothetical protein D9758_011825 [Tetrapyrgos nigripes]|uniref:DUF726-domain-containing protein n=1 Tax=Tetrapyrgos nigripes TaxID=182062 RepID=A0A8H5FNX7_9AGAR|nr:hypothetical protein D9758_011825 [Tetrapyrgos nigripes]